MKFEVLIYGINFTINRVGIEFVQAAVVGLQQIK